MVEIIKKRLQNDIVSKRREREENQIEKIKLQKPKVHFKNIICIVLLIVNYNYLRHSFSYFPNPLDKLLIYAYYSILFDLKNQKTFHKEKHFYFIFLMFYFFTSFPSFRLSKCSILSFKTGKLFVLTCYSSVYIYGTIIVNNNYFMTFFQNRKEIDEPVNEIPYHATISLSNETRSSKKTLKQVYMCSCGKQYLSFPATYLHFRTKHGIKLSTKPKEPRKHIKIEGKIRKIIYEVELKSEQYNLKPERGEAEKNEAPNLKDSKFHPVLQNISSCIARYFKSCHNQFSIILYEKLLNFFRLKIEQEEGADAQVCIGNIPLYMNDFVMNYLPWGTQNLERIWENKEKICELVKTFCDWLRGENYTQLQVLYENDWI